MNRFIGTKLINAKPMTRLAYNEFRGWTLPADENGNDNGYLVEYVDGGKANTKEFEGYISWSPEDVFIKSYIPVFGLTFSMALDAIKVGKKVARSGWNGKDMWIALGKGQDDLPADKFWNEHSKQHAENNGGKATVLPYILFKTATGEILMGWLASQTDMLSDDWMIL